MPPNFSRLFSGQQINGAQKPVCVIKFDLFGPQSFRHR
jgi:hypothetical protein